MDCQECNQRPATLHLTKVINGTKSEIHVCEKCAKEKGYLSYDEEAYSLHDLLSGLFNFDSSSLGGQKSNNTYNTTGLKCTKCGLTYQEFTQIGKFGCAECYQTFSEKLNPIFRRVHSGNTTHDGKVPKRIGTNIHQKRLANELKSKLKQLITDENFEEAAQIRDKIKEIEQDLDLDGKGED